MFGEMGQTNCESDPTMRPSAAKGGASNPIRILIVAPSLDILGGQAVQADRLLRRLQQELSIEVGFLPINPRLPGAFRKFQSIKYLRTIATSLMYWALLLTKVRKFDVIHVFSASYFSFLLAPTPAILVGKLFGKKIVLNYHSGEASDHLQRWRRTAIPTIRLVDEVAVPSDYLVRVFKSFNLSAKAIYNLVDVDDFPFRSRDPIRPVFLSNRNFEVHYGVDRVLRAFSLIQKRYPDARLTIAGHGPERLSLEALAGDLSLRNTEFIGRVPHQEIARAYDQADVFINGSKIDNQPLSLLEAFACGLPVVTSDAGGIPDIVANEKTGLLVRGGDYEALAAAALRVVEDNELAQRLIIQAHQELDKYSWPVLRKQWLDFYCGVSETTAVIPPTVVDNDVISAKSGIGGRS